MRSRRMDWFLEEFNLHKMKKEKPAEALLENVVAIVAMTESLMNMEKHFDS